LRDIPVLASADDFPFVAWSQRADTSPTQINPIVVRHDSKFTTNPASPE
jgi:hypothetical protein